MNHTNHLNHSRYVLAVNDLSLSADYYINKLGFKSAWKEGGWQMVTRNGTEIMLGECPDEIPAFHIGCHSYFAYIITANIDNLYNEFKANKVQFLSEPEDKPWNKREFGIMTCDGHRIMFAQDI